MIRALLVLLAASSLALACTSGNGDSAEFERLREENEQLRSAAADSNAPPAPTADGPLATAAPTPPASSTPTASPTPEPTPEPTAVSTPRKTMYVANTGGSGVSVRDACDDGARTSGAVPDATEVTVLQLGVGRCDGWSVVQAAARTTWVRDGYLSATKPATPTPTPRPTPKPTPSGPQPGEFIVVRTSITYNSIGTPQAYVTIRNTSNITIDAFDIRICMRNAYGELIEKYGYGAVSFIGVSSDNSIPPGGSYAGLWTLYGWDTTSSVWARPVRSHTTAGQTWESDIPLIPLCP